VSSDEDKPLQKWLRQISGATLSSATTTTVADKEAAAERVSEEAAAERAMEEATVKAIADEDVAI
jgi:hypothetical protein